MRPLIVDDQPSGCPQLVEILATILSHATPPPIFHSHRTRLTLVRAGCTGIGRPIDILVNRPFKDMLKGVIDKELELMD